MQFSRSVRSLSFHGANEHLKTSLFPQNIRKYSSGIVKGAKTKKHIMGRRNEENAKDKAQQARS